MPFLILSYVFIASSSSAQANGQFDRLIGGRSNLVTMLSSDRSVGSGSAIQAWFFAVRSNARRSLLQHLHFPRVFSPFFRCRRIGQTARQPGVVIFCSLPGAFYPARQQHQDRFASMSKSSIFDLGATARCGGMLSNELSAKESCLSLAAIFTFPLERRGMGQALWLVPRGSRRPALFRRIVGVFAVIRL